MKEATGELNMTIVTLVAISAIAALLWFVVWPMIQRMIVENTCQTYGVNWHATPNPAAEEGFAGNDGASDAEVSDWLCCPANDEGQIDSNDTRCFGTSLTAGDGE